MNNKILIFQHIPKTAGSTMHSIFNRHYRKSEIYNVFAANYKDKDVQVLASLKDNELSEIKIIKGHMPFGLHKFITEDFTYMTFIRDPIKRVVSQYHYINRNADNKLHKIVVDNRLSLGDLVRSGISVGLNNGQVRWLAGELHAYKFGEGQHLLEVAKDNIEKYYSMVGITEHFDESIMVMSRLLNWGHSPYYFRKNVTRKNNNKFQISPEDIEIVREFNQLDIELYEFLSQRFEAQFKDLVSFTELEKFQKVNRIYYILGRPFMLINR